MSCVFIDKFYLNKKNKSDYNSIMCVIILQNRKVDQGGGIENVVGLQNWKERTISAFKTRQPTSPDTPEGKWPGRG